MGFALYLFGLKGGAQGQACLGPCLSVYTKYTFSIFVGVWCVFSKCTPRFAAEVSSR